MSTTPEKLILAKALELWDKPSKRLRLVEEHNGRYCAIGVLNESTKRITGNINYYDIVKITKKIAQDMGYRDVNAMIDENDSPKGPISVYRRMQKLMEKLEE